MKKFRFLFFVLFLCAFLSASFAQTSASVITDDGEAALRYAEWMRQAIKEDRLEEALALIPRIGGFSDTSSDISYLIASVFSKTFKDRTVIISHLDIAIEINRWAYYSENEALVFKAEQLIAMRKYSSALAALDQIREGDIARDADISLFPLSNDAAMLRLKAFRGIAYNSLGATETAAFQTLALSAMNRFSRDPRPAAIFLEYLLYKKKQNQRINYEIDVTDQQILDIIIRRLPVLVELDPNLSWMAAPFMQNEADAKRYVAAYRAGSFLENAEGFIPNAKSIPLALYYGLINDIQAIEELFFMPINQSKNSYLTGIDLEVINETYDMLRSEEGREMFTRTLLNYSAYINTYDAHNGLLNSFVSFDRGLVNSMIVDINFNGTYDLRFMFDAGIPTQVTVPVSGSNLQADVAWERYPFVKYVSIPGELFNFRPADFSFAPLSFIVLSGSRNLTGITYPVLSNQLELSRRSLVSFCESIERASAEFENAKEIITLENGIPQLAVEYLIENDKIISTAEFEGGIPVIQYVDLDFDGRMETIRRFHRPGENFTWPDPDERFDYRRLLASSESDWRGDGRYKTGELYLPDGSVVYQYDIDGTGEMNYSEIKQRQ